MVTPIAITTSGGSAFSGSCTKEPALQTTVQTQKTDIRELKVGPGIEREMAGGDIHSYRLVLARGQYMRAVVEQRGVDVVVRLFGPNGQQITEVDSPNASHGPEPVSIIAEASGEYRLDVVPLDKTAMAGRYEIKVEELREAKSGDRDRIAAERAFAEGEQLRAEATAESLRKSIAEYREALRWKPADNPGWEPLVLDQIGRAHFQLGENQEALGVYGPALQLWRAIKDRYHEAGVLHEIAVVYTSLGEPQKALEYFRQSLQTHRGNPEDEGNTLTAMGLAYLGLGEPQKALENFHRALLLLRTAGDHRVEAYTLNHIGNAYRVLGEPTRALECHSQALLLLRAIGDRNGEAHTLRYLGQVHADVDEPQKALQYEGQALVLFRASGDRRGEAYVLSSLGQAHSELGEPQKALEYYNQELPLMRALTDRIGEANTLNGIGAVYLSLGDPLKALEYFNQAWSLQRTVGNRINEAVTLRGIAQAQRGLGHLAEARAVMRTALDLIESARLQVMSQQLRTSFSASRQDYYEFYIDLLMQMHRRQTSAGHETEAIQVSERARARGLLEILNEARANIRQGIDPALLEREHSLQQQLNAKSERLARLLGDKHTEEQAAAASKEVDALLEQYREVEGEIRTKSPRYAALTQPQPLSLKEIQQLLDEDTVLLEYSLGPERSYLWVVTTTSIKSFELPKRADIEAKGRQVYESLTARNKTVRFEKQQVRTARIAQADTDYLKASAELSEMVLAPVADQLGRRRLLIVSDGALQFIPFGALPVSLGAEKGSENRKPAAFEPLLVSHEVVSLPSASALAVLRKESLGRRRGAKTLAVLADPVFQEDDLRIKMRQARNGKPATDSLSKSSQARGLPSDIERSARDVGEVEFRRLPYSRKEANWIAAFTPKGMRKESLDFEANRTMATNADLSNYRIIHFATHGLLNNQHPELSGIVLSLVDEEGRPQDGFLRLHEIYNLKLGSDLVVLSACRTALGKDVRGEGLIGLTRGFMYAGASRVIASLWAVDDETTAELMKRFYRAMLIKRLRPAAALRSAQIRLWREKQLHPYYWSAFVMQGEWK
jgi:CHAT domain-containing protein